MFCFWKRRRIRLKKSRLLKEVGSKSVLAEEDFNRLWTGLSRSLSIDTLTRQTPVVIYMCGVNGAGKTTSIAKLIHSLINQTLFAPEEIAVIGTDTFRSAAMKQLQKRLENSKCDVWISEDAKKPMTALHQGLNKVLPQKKCLIVDTSGRLNTDRNLMTELQNLLLKGHQWSIALNPIAASKIILVCDGTHGNTLKSQYDSFQAVHPLDGVIYNKIDCLTEIEPFIECLQSLNANVIGFGTGEADSDLLVKTKI
jgi:fused signal recognition particle receptor